jgi:hypothetical protein
MDLMAGPIQADLHLDGQAGKQCGPVLVDQGRVGAKGHEQAAVERMLHDLEPVLPEQRLAAADGCGNTARRAHRRKEGLDLLRAQFLAGHLSRRQIAVPAAQVASFGDLQRHPLEDILPRNRTTGRGEQQVFLQVPAKGLHLRPDQGRIHGLAPGHDLGDCRRGTGAVALVQQFQAIRVHDGPARGLRVEDQGERTVRILGGSGDGLDPEAVGQPGMRVIVHRLFAVHGLSRSLEGQGTDDRAGCPARSLRQPAQRYSRMRSKATSSSGAGMPIHHQRWKMTPGTRN